MKNYFETNKERDLDDEEEGSLVKEILQNLPTTSKDYLYRRIGDLEDRGCIKDMTPDNREKHLVITNTGEDELISIIKTFFPRKEQQTIALRMFSEPIYVPK
ncbi:MAG: hypothetical protein KGD73_00750 [Candidatus Lokiarchaeota archaeon]|nr:hypothetical protein [Candidatus Lokiarchaeota archaeon]